MSSIKHSMRSGLILASSILATPVVLLASGAEIAPLEHRSVAPLDVAALATSTVGNGNQGCIRVLRFDVGQDAQGSPTATIGQQTTFIGPSGVFYWMPAIAATSTQNTVVPFIYGSTSVFLSSAFTTKGAAATTYPAATTFATGGCPSNPRTGDYQGAQTNPNDLASFWIAGEATPNAGSCSSVWRTQVVNVTP
ncbi:MAG TPA: hypothetical protein VOA87_18775 [Thermoanaerobaculia bacterium]|nr:hypothetical protein [Thermoanaerobaculia bacterium]